MRGNTPLHSAVASQCKSAIPLLAKLGADLNLQNDSGPTPLAFASEGHLHKLVELLLEHGADIGIASNSGYTPMHFVFLSEWDRSELYGSDEGRTIELLLRAGADLTAKDHNARTALDYVDDPGKRATIEAQVETLTKSRTE